MEEEKLFARIRKSSKYYGQNAIAKRQGNYPFPVKMRKRIPDEYVLVGGPGYEYRLSDVDLFALRNDELVCISEPEGPLMVQLKAIVKKSSPFFADNDAAAVDPYFGLPFPVSIDPQARHGLVVVGGPRPYSLEDVGLFVGDVKVSLNVD
jgi:hypothetical protein